MRKGAIGGRWPGLEWRERIATSIGSLGLGFSGMSHVASKSVTRMYSVLRSSCREVGKLRIFSVFLAKLLVTASDTNC